MHRQVLTREPDRDDREDDPESFPPRVVQLKPKPAPVETERDELHEEICVRVISAIGREEFTRRVEEKTAAFLRRLGPGRDILARRMAESTVCDDVLGNL